MIRVPSDPATQTRLQHAIAKALHAERQADTHYLEASERAVNEAQMHPVDKIPFQVLRRQFEGRVVPGLPTAVLTARRLLKAWRRARGNA